MQETIVFILTGLALLYLGYRFWHKKKSQHCDSCGFAPKETTKNNS